MTATQDSYNLIYPQARPSVAVSDVNDNMLISNIICMLIGMQVSIIATASATKLFLHIRKNSLLTPNSSCLKLILMIIFQ